MRRIGVAPGYIIRSRLDRWLLGCGASGKPAVEEVLAAKRGLPALGLSPRHIGSGAGMSRGSSSGRVFCEPLRRPPAIGIGGNGGARRNSSGEWRWRWGFFSLNLNSPRLFCCCDGIQFRQNAKVRTCNQVFDGHNLDFGPLSSRQFNLTGYACLGSHVGRRGIETDEYPMSARSRPTTLCSTRIGSGPTCFPRFDANNERRPAQWALPQGVFLFSCTTVSGLWLLRNFTTGKDAP